MGKQHEQGLRAGESQSKGYSVCEPLLSEVQVEPPGVRQQERT